MTLTEAPANTAAAGEGVEFHDMEQVGLVTDTAQDGMQVHGRQTVQKPLRANTRLTNSSGKSSPLWHRKGWQ